MEELFSDNRLGQLEEKIDGLLGVYRTVREEKAGLAERVQALETENREMREYIARIESEKNTIMQKVKGILEKIEKIEV